MLKSIFPPYLYHLFENVNLDDVQEIRLRVGSKIAIKKEKVYYLTPNGLSLSDRYAYLVKSAMLSDIISFVSNNSIYTINDQLLNGYITINGVRIGVAGELVYEKDNLKTLKNISSLNIRIPKIIKNCSYPVLNYLIGKDLKNVLIISPPGAGKTTFLRDFLCQIKKLRPDKNILVADERGEITSMLNGELKGMDVYKFCSKRYAFSNGIRSMAPDLIATDEINLFSDLSVIEDALTSGVNVVATIHASGLEDLKNKREFYEVLRKKMFDRFVVLGFSNGVGTIEGVYNEDLRCIYL